MYISASYLGFVNFLEGRIKDLLTACQLLEKYLAPCTLRGLYKSLFANPIDSYGGVPGPLPRDIMGFVKPKG